MRHDPGLAEIDARVAGLNRRYAHHAAIDVLRLALRDRDVGRVAMVSSFGAESVALLHLVSVVDPRTPVLFIDTEMLFPETRAYQVELAEKLGLEEVRVLRAPRTGIVGEDPEGDLHKTDPDACCTLRKTRPLARALEPFDAWITGRKRFQGGTRAELEFFEREPGADRIKINPLAHWDKDGVQDYVVNNRLPRHPLVRQGYPSIGCAPCTSPVAEGEDERAGRWRGSDKTECGIHFINGKAVRGPIEQENDT
ncbi:phosphoadenylyl-sulfate reductase [Palleronia caenipelagi]|uniref:Adenosine 5'-phosphosulfate reductase n=1 Tax=Palleronia caenipelagi TaxID=2489174 RepID=A0A547QAU2_9RHOB|nr:phosphoadenylyl-sulfate reductase [Palleronia caenipelagi]TRD23511.1 phosphoadenylyl-sulfate reductase [Palleronia caenipelagi]